MRTWMRFNIVGLMGFVLQTATLWVFVDRIGVRPGVAVTLAVLAAVSHNFAWHERFTWPNLPREQWLQRWLSFHLSTGIVSVAANVGVTMLVVALTGFPVVAANTIAVAVASLVNFWVNDRFVFRCIESRGHA